jgi:hypothetical protein
VYSFFGKLEDAYCHMPFYKNHLNPGFNFGSKLSIPDSLVVVEGTDN